MIVPKLTFLQYRKSYFVHTVLKCNGGILYPQPLVVDKLTSNVISSLLTGTFPLRKDGRRKAELSNCKFVVNHVIYSFNTFVA